MVYLFLISIGCIVFALAIESLLKSSSKLNVSAACVLSLLALYIAVMGLHEYLVSIGDFGLAFWATKIQNFALILFGGVFYFFSSFFPRDDKMVGREKVVIYVTVIFAVMGISALLGWDIESTSSVENSPIIIQYNIYHYVVLSLSALLFLLSNVEFLFKYRRVELVYQKKQIYYYYYGLASLLVFPLIGAALSYFFGSLFYNILLGLGILSYGGFILYAVLNYRFVNIRKKLYKFMREIGVGCLVSLPLVLIIFIFRQPLGSLSPLIYFIVMIPSFVLFFWLYQLSLNLVRRLFKMEEDTKDLTGIFIDKMGFSHNIEELASNTVTALMEELHCRNIDFLSFDREREVFVTLASANNRSYQIPAIDPFFRHIHSHIEILDRETMYIDPSYHNIRSIAERYFSAYDTFVLVPLYYEDTLECLLNISRKFDNNTFNPKDFAVISKARKIASLTMKNIILFDKEQEAKITKQDLNLASNIQSSVFQREIPQFKKMDVFGYQKPAKWVSGDYFLIEKISEHQIGFLISDVSGKGVSAALISMMIHSIAKSQEFASTTTNAIVSKINEVMTSNESHNSITKVMSFATVFCGFLDYKQKTLYYTNAGHNPAIIYDTTLDSFEVLSANGIPTGIYPDKDYQTNTYQLDYGKILVFYSDGITETINESEEEFGVERLQELIRQNAKKTTQEMTDIIIESVEEFSDFKEQFDDITLIIIKL